MPANTSLQSHRKAFCLGNILPDIQPSFVTKRHEYFGTFDEVQEKIILLVETGAEDLNDRVFWRRIGEVMHYFIPLPVPASIYGMAILFVGLMTKIIPLDYVEDAGKLMIEIMPVMFIPAGVGLMASFGVLKPMIIPFCVVLIVTVVTVIIITGHVSQFIIRSGKKKNKENE